MLDYPQSPVPEICISPAPDVEVAEEPESPFGCLSPKFADDDGYRPSLLSPPPSAGSRGGKLSPLRPDDAPAGKGLARERFDALLAASRERNASVGAKKATDLRKEIALKAHKSKQLERRALFLSKVKAPPSPSAAELPKTPPESPAIFHYTLPSPGLVSPLSLFESIANNNAPGLVRQPWVEQVDFRLPEGVKMPRDKPRARDPASPRSRRQRSIPSLEEITARLGAHGHVVTAPTTAHDVANRRLPAFLQSGASAPQRKPSPPPIVVTAPAQEPRQRQPLPIGVGRLRMPVRSGPTKPTDPVAISAPMPKSPGAPKSPNLRITTTVVPRSSTTSPIDLTETNLSVLNSRARTARDMLSALRRRTAGPASSQNGLTGHDDDRDDSRKHLKRHSAPAELAKRERCGFAHPVLALPGAF